MKPIGLTWACLLFIAPFGSAVFAEPEGPKASGRSIEIKLESPKSTDGPMRAIKLVGFAGEPIELRCPASLVPLETGKRVMVRLIQDFKGKRISSAIGVGGIKNSKEDLEELFIPMKLPAKPGRYQMEVSQNQNVILKGDFEVKKAE